jgi:hypothetical protein
MRIRLVSRMWERPASSAFGVAASMVGEVAWVAEEALSAAAAAMDGEGQDGSRGALADVHRVSSFVESGPPGGGVFTGSLTRA